MNSKTIIAGILGGICSFLMGWLLYGVLFKDIMAGMEGSATGVMRADDEMVFWALILGNLIMGILIAYIFSQWASINTLMGGLIGGATFGGLFATGYNFIFYGTTNVITLSGLFMDIVINIILWGVSSAIIGWWLGRSSSN